MPQKFRNFLVSRSFLALVLLCCFGVAELACGGGGNSIVQTPVPAGQPTFSHVVLLVEENHSYSEVIGNSSMPYFNSLASKYGLATQYFANAHPSLPNYLVLTTGQMETLSDNFSGTISDDNVVRELSKTGKSWKAYIESLPSPGYLGTRHRHLLAASRSVFVSLGCAEQQFSSGQHCPVHTIRQPTSRTTLCRSIRSSCRM